MRKGNRRRRRREEREEEEEEKKIEEEEKEEERCNETFQVCFSLIIHFYAFLLPTNVQQIIKYIQ
jgi:hypothetical protein